MRLSCVLGAALVLSLAAIGIAAGCGPTSARSGRSGPSTELLVLDRSTLQIVQATSGRVLHQVTVHGPTARHRLLLTRSYNTDNLVAAWIPAS